MKLRPYQWMKELLWGFVLLSSMGGAVQTAQAQAIVQVRVLSTQILNNVDCDGFLTGDSDFVWEFTATGNGIPYTNNNPSTCALIGQGSNIAFRNGNNGPYTITAPSGDMNPSSGLFFNHQCVCVPTQIIIDWEAYENDNPCDFDLGGLLSEGNVSETFTIPVPGVPGSSGPITRTLSSGGGCAQTYRITFEVVRATWATAINYMEDNICNATQIPINNTQTYGWCPGANLEVGEPHTGDVSAHGSRWLYFVAPASGEVEISTDFGGTEFGTYFEIYHAADGAGCTAGIQPITAATIKRKFEYLSHTEFSDGTDFLGIDPEAEITLDACDPVAPFSYQKLHPGQVYYLQITADNANEGGFIQVRVSDLGGSSPPNPEDIPCTAPLTAINTTAVSAAGGNPATRTLNFGCAYDGGNDFGETGNFSVGNNPNTFHAYDYNHVATNNNTMNESVWAPFVAPNSGRIVFETEYDSDLFGENSAFFGYDQRFSPGTPADYLCSNLTVMDAANGGANDLFSSAITSAIIERRCLEPGYTYFPMVDPSDNLTIFNTQSIGAWLYDPSVADPASNPPGNDVLCLAMANPLYEVPVEPFNNPLPFNAVAGSNVNACFEHLAGEPHTSANPATRADQTVWHYFTCPPSGVVDIKIRAYIGMNTLNYAIYDLLNGTDCYGGLNPATFTTDGTRNTPIITPIASGSTDFAGTVVSLCCLRPGDVYAIQIDGGSPGDEGQYIIEYIEEIEVYAGNSQYGTEFGDTTTYLAVDTSYICYGDSIFPSTMLDPLGNSTVRIPLCLDQGFVIHNTLPIPDPIANIGFSYIDSIRFAPIFFINDGNGSGSFGNPMFNQVYYVSALADETSTWGDLTCHSASMENGAPVVYLRQIVPTSSYDPNNCVLSFSANGGLPAYNGSLFSYVITNSAGDTVSAGTAGNGVTISYAIAYADTYTVTMTDGAGCDVVIVINANLCLDPCINFPVVINPSPIDSTVYTCLPGGDSATVTIYLSGGDPTVNGTDYTVIVSGSTAGGANGTFTVSPTGASTAYSFTVRDGDTWQVIASDMFACADTAAHTFTYDLTNCPDYCSINPMFISYTYDCLPTGQAFVNVTLSGGAPAIDGSSYHVSTSGSTVFGQTFNNAQVPGVIGGSTGFSMIVNDGDSWQITVIDNNLCSDTLSDNYTFDVNHCPNLCTLIPLAINPDPITSSVYDCMPNGTATVTLNFSGGDPAVNGTSYTVVVSGSSVAGANGTYTTGIGSFQFTVGDGDTWQVILNDVNSCADTASGTFDFNLSNCPDICTLLPLTVGAPVYDCNADGTATVSVTISGGLPSYDGSNYLVTVTGSSAGGNVSNAPFAGSIGSSVTYSFLVDDGDNWQIDVADSEGCNDSQNGTFVFNDSNCPDICTLLPMSMGYNGYLCNTDGTASVTVYILGGTPSYDGSNYLVTINGTSTGSNVLNAPVAGAIGDTTFYTFTVGDGDVWQVFIEDGNDCNTNTSGNFVWNATNCGNVCGTLAPIEINGGTGFLYDCDGNGGASVTLTVTGGTPSLGGAIDTYTALVTINGGTSSYTVQSNGNMGTLVIGLQNGDSWSAMIFDEIGCDTAEVLNTVFNTVNAVATTNATGELLIGQTASIDASQSTGNNLTYSWTPLTGSISGLTDFTAVTTTVQPLETTVYTVEVTDDEGCSDRDSVEVLVGRCVPLHAGFTPNNDGTNDLWLIPCLDLFANRVEVYNRWGQLVFQRDNYTSANAWNGESGGQPLPDAAYYYVITVEYTNLPEPVIYKGTVTIIR